MPLVKATPKGLQNGNIITEFTDTTNLSAVTYTYPTQQTSLVIENSGEKDIFVTVGSYTDQLIQADKKWKADTPFTSFSIKSNVNSQEFIATATFDSEEDLASLTARLATIPQQTYITEKAKTTDVNNALVNKVDKVTGKGLSTNDYNDTEKAEVAKVALKADTTYVDSKVSAIDRGYGGTYASLSAIQSAFPTGNTNRYVASDNGHWYFWNGSAWTDGGVFQGIGIPVNSITENKLAFVPLKGTAFKNLFNKSTVTDGYYVNYQTGALLANATYSTSDWIPVSPSTVYTRAIVGSQHTAFYDATKNYISGVLTQSFTTPANAAYARIAVLTSDLNIEQFESGNTPTVYESYGSTLLNLKDKSINEKFLADKSVSDRTLADELKKEFFTQYRFGTNPVYVTANPWQYTSTGTSLSEWVTNDTFVEGDYYLRFTRGNQGVEGLLLRERIPSQYLGLTNKKVTVKLTYASTSPCEFRIYQQTSAKVYTNPATYVSVNLPSTNGEKKIIYVDVTILSDGYYLMPSFWGLSTVGGVLKVGSINYSIMGNIIDTQSISTETIITVSSTGGDYTTIQAALDYANANASVANKIIINLGKETYNEGLLNILSDNIVLQGQGREETIIRCDGTVIRTDLTKAQKHGISTMGNIEVNDLMIDVNDVKYPVHNDASTGVGSSTKSFKAVFNRCVLKHRGCADNSYYNAIGEGLYGGQFTEYNDCIFEYTGNAITDGAYALFWHNWNNQSKKCGTSINNGKCYGYEIAKISELGSDKTDVVSIRNTTSNVPNARVRLQALQGYYVPATANATEVPYNIQLALEGTYNTVIDRTTRPLKYQYI